MKRISKILVKISHNQTLITVLLKSKSNVPYRKSSSFWEIKIIETGPLY